MIEGQSVEIGLYDASLRDIDLPIGLRVESVHLSGGAIQLYKDPFRAVAAQPGKVRVLVDEESMAEFIAKNPPWGMKNIRITLADNKLVFEATKTVLIDLKVKAICTLRIEEEASVFIDLQSVDVVGAGVTQLVQSHIEKLNPIINTGMLPFPMKLIRLEMAHGKLSLWGEVTPPE